MLCLLVALKDKFIRRKFFSGMFNSIRQWNISFRYTKFIELFIIFKSICVKWMYKSKANINYLLSLLSHLEVPVILWWTPFGSDGKLRKCGNYQCYFTSNRSFQYHQQLSVILYTFYIILSQKTKFNSLTII